MTITVADLRHRNFIKLLDFTPDELLYLIDLARDLKASKRNRTTTQYLVGKEIALIFEKRSTRTRCSFEVAAYNQGAHVTYLGPEGSHIGHKESMKDTARVLGRLYDGIEFRGRKQEDADILARYAGVPIWNGLTDDSHPTQILCDMLTMIEHSNKPLNAVTVASVLTIVCLHSPFQKKTSRLNNSRRKWPFRQWVTQKKLLKDGTIVVVGASAPKNQTIS